MPEPRVVVVGGGLGGLAAAIRLRVAGHPVVLCERGESTGGKISEYERDGHVFDTGPSLLTMPRVLDDLFRVADARLSERIELVRLDPQFRYTWPDGSRLTVHDDPRRTADAFERFAPGAAAQWRRFDARGREIWDVATRTFFAGPMDDPISMLRRMRSPRDLARIDGARTLASAAAAIFDDLRLQQWAGRYATYSGSSPFTAPATMACIPHVESREGAWYPMGGLGALRRSVTALALETGVEIRTGAEVSSIRSDHQRVRGVTLQGGERIDADVVVANADAEHVYRDLLPLDDALAAVRRAPRSTSGFVMCIGVAGSTAGLEHHNVWFSADSHAEFAEIAGRGVASDPTVYACVSSRTDPTQAPHGQENWFLLVNTRAGAQVDHDDYGELVLDRLASRGCDLRERELFRHTIGPAEMAVRFRSPGGAIYGTSSDGRRAAFLRPGNRGPRRGLYLVGGSSHPGGGIPLVTTSARIVADMVAEDTAT